MSHEPVGVVESPPARRPIRRVGWVALGFSIVVTAGLWLAVASAISGGLVGEAGWPVWLITVAGFFIGAGAPLIIVAIILSLIAGRRGGRTRRAAVIGGLVLLSPIIAWAGWAVVAFVANLFDPGGA